MKKTRKKISIFIVLLIVVISSLRMFYLNPIYNSEKLDNNGKLKTSAQESFTKQWIENPFFTSTDNWTSSKGILGDPDDVAASINNGLANYEILGDQFTFNLVNNTPNDYNWYHIENADNSSKPDDYFIVNDGLFVSHEWHEDENQSVTAQWDRPINLNVDMSKYNITSASLEVFVNATVHGNDGQSSSGDLFPRGIEVQGDNDPIPLQISTGDYVEYFVLISTLDKTKKYPIASHRPYGLGRDSDGTFSELEDTSFIADDEEELIFSINKILKEDIDHQNFIITLGIKVFCEDNFGYDKDTFDELFIKNISLSFTAEKLINQFTSISWNQEAYKISEDISIVNYTSFEVNEARLNFKYILNDSWPISSPNSEIQIIVNGIPHSETINLLQQGDIVFKDAKSGGFDVTSLISDDVNLSIRVFIADHFGLSQAITVSIDNVSLDISYTVEFDDYQTNLQLFLNGEDKTPPIYNPSIEVPIGQNVTITVKYTNQTGGHIPNANVQLTGPGLIKNLKEFTNNYSITLNSTLQLNMDINTLFVEATKTNFVTEEIYVTIIVRKIHTEIITVSGDSTIDIDVGGNAQLEIMLNDTDNNKLIKGAIVTYTWDLDPIPRVLTENNGIYEGAIENPPEGPYTITISAFAGEYYEFEDFEIALYVGTYVPQPQPDWSWLIYILTGAILGLVLVFTLYQTHFKYPPLVRKIRKLKKKVRKGNKTKPIPVNKREEIIKNNIQEQARILDLEITQSERKSVDKIDLKEKVI
ncbi:MAG: hypothetical protein JSV62_04670 [Promethearchaeota archaeon]|nr:MAG: hypothetical protein JSV62_04670 [Candidatus Lokiarchaeota archaeon]